MAVIFFDYDGVLVDSLDVEAKYFSEACHSYGVEGINTSEDMAKLSEGNFYEGMVAMGISAEKIDAVMKKYGEIKMDGRYQIPYHAPMMKLLRRLAKHFPLYIVTSNTSATVEKRMEELEIKGVREILGAEGEKSKVKKIRRIMEMHPGEKSLFIGDTKGDMVESKEAGVDIRLGVTWGWQEPWVVLSGNPDYYFDDFETIRVWFKGFLDATK